MPFSRLSRLEQDVYNAYGEFSNLLTRLHNVEYEVKMKKSPGGMTHIFVKPQGGIIYARVRKYPGEIRIPNNSNYIIMDDINSALQKRFIKYLLRELPYLQIKERED